VENYSQSVEQPVFAAGRGEQIPAPGGAPGEAW